jgi:hypothetical protein
MVAKHQHECTIGKRGRLEGWLAADAASRSEDSKNRLARTGTSDNDDQCFAHRATYEV